MHGGQIGVRLPDPQLSSWLPSAGVLMTPLCHKGLSNLLMAPGYCWERTEKHHCIFGKTIFLFGVLLPQSSVSTTAQDPGTMGGTRCPPHML